MTPYEIVLLLNIHCSPVIQFVPKNTLAYRNSIFRFNTIGFIRPALASELSSSIEDSKIRLTSKGLDFVTKLINLPID